jgi:endonuclease/exonuclease/phosphatase (EEP) superfamily protein YafD
MEMAACDPKLRLVILQGKEVNTTKLNDWMQVIGIFAVVASLIFVGLEMRQAQEISMSQTYQSRTAAVAEWNSAFAANPAALSALRKATEGNDDEITTQEFDALRRTLTGMYYLYDNAHYQYQAGFVSSEFWGMTRETLTNIMKIPVVKDVLMEMSRRGGRPEFRDLMQEIGRQLEAQADD